VTETPTTHVFLRPIGSPLTLGMSGLAIASFVQSGLDLGWVSTDQAPYVGMVMLGVAFFLQFLAAVLAFLARDGAAGATLGILATTWLAVGLVEITSVNGQPSGGLGLALLAAGTLLPASAIAVSLAKPLAGVLFAVAGVRFVLTGSFELSENHSLQDIAGVLGLVIAALATYAVLAFELEGQKLRPVLPTFRRGRGERAIAGDAAEQVTDMANEAGVRQTT